MTANLWNITSKALLSTASWEYSSINSSPPGQYGHHYANDIFRCIFLNEKFRILVRISLKFVSKGPIDNKWALVRVMAWHWIGNKPLPQLMLIQFTNAYMRHKGEIN